MNLNKRVYVYRNLHTGDFSVRQSGIVIGHTDSILLQDCRFLVSQKGRQRVIRTGRKNVHAGVSGYNSGDMLKIEYLTPVKYNPYKTMFFMCGDVPVHESKYVLLENNEVFVAELR